jgi:hypothetical protein
MLFNVYWAAVVFCRWILGFIVFFVLVYLPKGSKEGQRLHEFLVQWLRFLLTGHTQA